MPMQTTGAKSIGTVLSQVGSERQSMTGRSDQTRDLAVARAQPSTIFENLSPERKQELKALLAGPVMSMTPILQADPSEQRAMWIFWIEAVAGYSSDAIRRAFIAATKRKEFLNPKLIVSILEAERAEDLKLAARHRRDLEAQAEYERDLEREICSPERKAEIMREVFGDG